MSVMEQSKVTSGANMLEADFTFFSAPLAIWYNRFVPYGMHFIIPYAF